MTADEFRKQRITNTRLAWLVYGHKVPLESLQDFTEEELKLIRQVEDDEETMETINKLLGHGSIL